MKKIITCALVVLSLAAMIVPSSDLIADDKTDNGYRCEIAASRWNFNYEFFNAVCGDYWEVHYGINIFISGECWGMYNETNSALAVYEHVCNGAVEPIFIE